MHAYHSVCNLGCKAMRIGGLEPREKFHWVFQGGREGRVTIMQIFGNLLNVMHLFQWLY
jgi:hypothetical protein